MTLILGGGLFLLLYSLVALPRSAMISATVVGLGIIGIAALGYSFMSTPCTSDPAGCGMSRGYEGLILMGLGTPLLGGSLAAIGWRALAGRDAGLGHRLLAAA